MASPPESKSRHSSRSSVPERWSEGARAFNEGRYWDCHEHWEHAWRVQSGPLKTHVQALIQVAAVFVLLEKGRIDAAMRVCASARDKLAAGAAFDRGEQSRPEIVVEGGTPLVAALEHVLRSPEAWKSVAQGLRAVVCPEPCLT